MKLHSKKLALQGQNRRNSYWKKIVLRFYNDGFIAFFIILTNLFSRDKHLLSPMAIVLDLFISRSINLYQKYIYYVQYLFSLKANRQKIPCINRLPLASRYIINSSFVTSISSICKAVQLIRRLHRNTLSCHYSVV